MNELPRLEPAIGYLASRGIQPSRSVSDSPTRHRNTDELLSQLTPRTAVDAFQNPSGALKRCMDAATLSEQAFAMRAAVASKSIQEWLEELHGWPWPTHDASAGFERPPAKRRKLFSSKRDTDQAENSTEADEPYEMSFLGSLLATEVARYERRVNEIRDALDNIDLEEIKNQVLHNHIMPLSRPGTPLTESFRRPGTPSASAFARMDDFTAIITSTIIQVLPNLCRLTSLLNTWTVRLRVLRRSSTFLTALEDAEIALQAGWNAMEVQSTQSPKPTAEGKTAMSGGSILSRQDFDRMKLVVEKLVARAGHHLDHMLNALEGSEDILPEDWIDRLDTAEEGYAEWVATCERKIREADWAKLMREASGTKDDPLQDSEKERIGRSVTAQAESLPRQVVVGDDELSGPATAAAEVPRVTDAKASLERSHKVASGSGSPPTIKVHLAEEETIEAEEPNHEQPLVQTTDSDLKGVQPSIATTVAEQQPNRDSQAEADMIDNQLGRFDGLKPADLPHGSVSSGSLEDSERETEPCSEGSDRLVALRASENAKAYHDGSDDEESDIEYSDDSEVPEPELPVMPRPRRESDMSNTSTVLHGRRRDGFGSFSSDVPEQGTPDYHRLRDTPLLLPEGGDIILPLAEDEDSDLPSSPPNFRSSARSIRSFSVSFNEIPTVHEVPNEDTPPRTPFGVSFADESTDDDSDLAADASEVDISTRNSLSVASVAGVTSADDHLQQQISDILESIPAKIKLTSKPPAVNLNPPDFDMPTRPKSKTDPTPRSLSAMSNRSSRSSRPGTPSFTLAPAYAKQQRSRHHMNQQEIKLYHLSRSNGEAPIKLFIRCVGEGGERVMVRVGGGWADLGEYLKEYATHHSRRPGEKGRIEVRDVPHPTATTTRTGSSPPSRPGSMPPTRPPSAMGMTPSPTSPLHVRKTRRSTAAEEMTKVLNRQPLPKTPLGTTPLFLPPTATADANGKSPSPGGSPRSRTSSRSSWAGADLEGDTLGMAGPKGKQVEITPESLAWIESVKEKVRAASGELPKPEHTLESKASLGNLGKVGATKRLFRRGQTPDLRAPGSAK